MSVSDTTAHGSGTLHEWVAVQGQLSHEQAISITLTLIRSVSKLHDDGQTHRAIDEHCVMLDRDRVPTLTASKSIVTFGGGHAPASPCPPQLLGTREVSLPAHIDAARAALTDAGILLDPRQIDFFQLGALLCMLVSGEKVPSYLRSPKAKAAVPEALRPVIDRALGLNAGDHFVSCNEFATALEAAARGDATATRDRSALPRSVFTHNAVESPDADPASSGPDDDAVESSSPMAPDPIIPLAESETDQEPSIERLGHYQIIERIGRGGMGDVYKAYEEDLDRIVAIKVLPAELVRHKDLLKRFRGEAAAIAKLDHPNVVQIYYIGEDRSHHFFAMQYVDGETLAELLDRRAKLRVEEALPIIEQCLAGLGAAHDLNLIHRDMKPGNVLLDRRSRRALVADFGLVKGAQAQTQITVTGMVMGTADYIAPEQARGRSVDHRADLYAFGVMIYQMIAGRLPFHADSATALMFQHAYEPPPPLNELEPELPEPLVQIVMKLLVKDPEDRYQSADEVLADLRRISMDAIAGAAPHSSLIAAPRFGDPPPLPTDLTDIAPTDWWGRLRARVADGLGSFGARPPQLLARWQNTQQQVDGAVAEYERRRDELAALHQEADDLAADLQRQANRHAEDASSAARRAESSNDVADKRNALQEQLSREQNAAELAQLAAEQHEHAEDIGLRLGKVEATLVQVHAQRHALDARLKAAQAQVQVMSRHGAPRHWTIRLAAMFAAVLFGVLILMTVTRRPQDRSVPSQTIDLLKLVKPDRMAVEGQWQFRGTDLVVDKTPAARISLPYTPPLEYDFIVEYTLSDDSGCVAQLTSRNGVPFTWSMNAGRPARCRLEDIDGHSVIGNPTLQKHAFEAGKAYTSMVSVRDEGVICRINGEVIADYETDYSDLSRNTKWEMPDPALLILGAWNGPITFHRVVIREVTGEGTEALALDTGSRSSPSAVSTVTMLAPGHYNAMLGSYRDVRHEAPPLPLVNLNVPNGKNTLHTDIITQMKQVAEFESSYAAFDARASFTIPRKGQYRLEASRACSVSIDGSEYKLDNYGRPNLAAFEFEQGTHLIELSVVNNGGQLYETSVAIKDVSTGQSIPIHCSAEQIRTFLETPINGTLPVQVTHWHPAHLIPRSETDRKEVREPRISQMAQSVGSQAGDAVPFNGHWYKLFSTPTSWHDAKARCEQVGGYLACVTSEQEHRFVLKILDGKVGWLGGTDKQEEGHWKWISGEAFQYYGWLPGEPSNTDGKEHALGVGNQDGSARLGWNDWHADGRIPFVCEWEAAPHETVTGTLYLSADDAFDLRINEQIVTSGRLEPVAIERTFNVGDRITAKVTNSHHDFGFMLFFQSKDKKHAFFSNLSTWKAYTPSNPLKWWKVSLSPKDPTASQGHKKYIKIPESSGYGVDAIWGIDKGTSFIYHVVTAQDLSRDD